MSTLPNGQSSSDPRNNRADENTAPEKAELLRCIVRWFRGFHLHREKSKATDWLTVALTLGVAIAAIWSALIFDGQLTTMRRDSVRAENESISARRHAREQIRFLQEQLNAMEDQTELDQRAWVGFEDIREFGQVGIPSAFSFTLKNTGKTPALHVELKEFIKKVNRGEKLHFTYKDMPPEPTRGLIMPSATFYVNKQNAIPNQGQMNLIASDEQRVYFYGRTDYDDIFGRHHWTTFCSYMARDGSVAVICPEYNDADDTRQKPN